MTKISVKGKDSRFSSLSGDFWTDDGHNIYIGKDWALQNEITETRLKTEARACYRACRTCNHCSNSLRDGSSCSSQYDANSGKMIHCTMCEKFGFCDCRNGFFRNAHQDAEPFTPDVQETIKTLNGKPLI